jgi:hypothetical protein
MNFRQSLAFVHRSLWLDMRFREADKPLGMRTVPIVLAFVAIVVGGCITFSGEPTPTPSRAPTDMPMITPEPTAQPTEAPTPGPPTPTPDPNATPRPTPIDIAPFLTSEVTILNLGDAPLGVTVTLLDPDSAEEFTIGTFHLEAGQVTHQSIIPALFRLDFGYSGVSDLGSCAITVGEAEQIQFAAVPTGIAMATSGAAPADPAEMLVATSSRCRADSGS